MCRITPETRIVVNPPIDPPQPVRKSSNHCTNGHLFDFVYPSGKRCCRTCHRKTYGKYPSLSADRPAKKFGMCVCGGDILRPLKAKPVWVCLECQTGSLRGGSKILYFTGDQTQRYYRDEITLEELMETKGQATPINEVWRAFPL